MLNFRWSIEHSTLYIEHYGRSRFTSDGQRGWKNTIAASITHVDFPSRKVTVRMSEELTTEGDVEHHGESDSNAPKTRQPLDRKKNGTPEVQRPQDRKAHD